MRPVAELGVAMLVKTSVEALVFRKLMPRLVGIALLMLFSLCLLGACGAIVVYQLYLMLIHAGLAQEQALAVLGGSLFMLASLSAMFALRRLKELQKQLQPLLPLKEKLWGAARAFSEGIRTPSR